MTVRRLYREGTVIASSSDGLRISMDRSCGGCRSLCGAVAGEPLSLARKPIRPVGERVSVSLSAEALNTQCGVLFGPWLLVVAGLIGMDAAGVGSTALFSAALAGGAIAFWTGRRLALSRLDDLSIAVDAVLPAERV